MHICSKDFPYIIQKHLFYLIKEQTIPYSKTIDLEELGWFYAFSVDSQVWPDVQLPVGLGCPTLCLHLETQMSGK